MTPLTFQGYGFLNVQPGSPYATDYRKCFGKAQQLAQAIAQKVPRSGGQDLVAIVHATQSSIGAAYLDTLNQTVEPMITQEHGRGFVAGISNNPPKPNAQALLSNEKIYKDYAQQHGNPFIAYGVQANGKVVERQ
jgi:hypothetical protein